MFNSSIFLYYRSHFVIIILATYLTISSMAFIPPFRAPRYPPTCPPPDHPPPPPPSNLTKKITDEYPPLPTPKKTKNIIPPPPRPPPGLSKNEDVEFEKWCVQRKKK